MCGCRTETKAERTNGLNEVGPAICLCVGTMIWTPTVMTAFVGTFFWEKGRKQTYTDELTGFYGENNLTHWNYKISMLHLPRYVLITYFLIVNFKIFTHPYKYIKHFYIYRQSAFLALFYEEEPVPLN